MQYILSMGRMRNTTTSDWETGGGLAVEENIVKAGNNYESVVVGRDTLR